MYTTSQTPEFQAAVQDGLLSLEIIGNVTIAAPINVNASVDIFGCPIYDFFDVNNVIASRNVFFSLMENNVHFDISTQTPFVIQTGATGIVISHLNSFRVTDRNYTIETVFSYDVQQTPEPDANILFTIAETHLRVEPPVRNAIARWNARQTITSATARITTSIVESQAPILWVEQNVLKQHVVLNNAIFNLTNNVLFRVHASHTYGRSLTLVWNACFSTQCPCNIMAWDAVQIIDAEPLLLTPSPGPSETALLDKLVMNGTCIAFPCVSMRALLSEATSIVAYATITRITSEQETETTCPETLPALREIGPTSRPSMLESTPLSCTRGVFHKCGGITTACKPLGTNAYTCVLQDDVPAQCRSGTWVGNAASVDVNAGNYAVEGGVVRYCGLRIDGTCRTNTLHSDSMAYNAGLDFEISQNATMLDDDSRVFVEELLALWRADVRSEDGRVLFTDRHDENSTRRSDLGYFFVLDDTAVVKLAPVEYESVSFIVAFGSGSVDFLGGADIQTMRIVASGVSISGYTPDLPAIPVPAVPVPGGRRLLSFGDVSVTPLSPGDSLSPYMPYSMEWRIYKDGYTPLYTVQATVPQKVFDGDYGGIPAAIIVTREIDNTYGHLMPIMELMEAYWYNLNDNGHTLQPPFAREVVGHSCNSFFKGVIEVLKTKWGRKASTWEFYVDLDKILTSTEGFKNFMRLANAYMWIPKSRDECLKAHPDLFGWKKIKTKRGGPVTLYGLATFAAHGELYVDWFGMKYSKDYTDFENDVYVGFPALIDNPGESDVWAKEKNAFINENLVNGYLRIGHQMVDPSIFAFLLVEAPDVFYETSTGYFLHQHSQPIADFMYLFKNKYSRLARYYRFGSAYGSSSRYRNTLHGILVDATVTNDAVKYYVNIGNRAHRRNTKALVVKNLSEFPRVPNCPSQHIHVSSEYCKIGPRALCCWLPHANRDPNCQLPVLWSYAHWNHDYGRARFELAQCGYDLPYAPYVGLSCNPCPVGYSLYHGDYSTYGRSKDEYLICMPDPGTTLPDPYTGESETEGVDLNYGWLLAETDKAPRGWYYVVPKKWNPTHPWFRARMPGLIFLEPCIHGRHVKSSSYTDYVAKFPHAVTSSSRRLLSFNTTVLNDTLAEQPFITTKKKRSYQAPQATFRGSHIQTHVKPRQFHVQAQGNRFVPRTLVSGVGSRRLLQTEDEDTPGITVEGEGGSYSVRSVCNYYGTTDACAAALLALRMINVSNPGNQRMLMTNTLDTYVRLGEEETAECVHVTPLTYPRCFGVSSTPAETVTEGLRSYERVFLWLAVGVSFLSALVLVGYGVYFFVQGQSRKRVSLKKVSEDSDESTPLVVSKPVFDSSTRVRARGVWMGGLI